MKLLIENWRQYLTEGSLTEIGLSGTQKPMDRWKSMSYQEKAAELQEFFAAGEGVIGPGGERWEGYFNMTIARYKIFSEYANDNIIDELKELSGRLKNFKDQEMKNKLINNIFSDGGSWVQVLELLRTL